MRYAALSELLEEAGVALSLSELHGGLCGLLCAAGTGAADTWLEEVIGVGDSGVRIADKMVCELRALRLETWGQLAGSQMQFTPLMPKEDCVLGKRVEAFAEWCHGFLFGLGLGRVSLGGGTAAQVREFADDLAVFSRAGLSFDERDNEVAADFMLAQLVEHVRVGVQIVFEELESTRIGSTNRGKGH